MKVIYKWNTVISNHVTVILIGLFMLIFAACTTTYNPLNEYVEVTPAVVEVPSPGPVDAISYAPERIARGKYMVELLNCGSCHTDQALLGKPDKARFLAGSRVGIAYSNPLKEKFPGVLYPANLTPDPETGLGKWTDEQILQILRTGIDPYGYHTLSVMPWTVYSKLSEEDAQAIVAFLRSLPAVKHKVPANVLPGSKAIEPFVHFGVYQKSN